MKMLSVVILTCLVLTSIGCGVAVTSKTHNAKIAEYEHRIDGLKEQVKVLKSGLSACETSFEKYQTQQKIAQKQNQIKQYEYFLYIYEKNNRAAKK